jgi:hypothetical protein
LKESRPTAILLLGGFVAAAAKRPKSFDFKGDFDGAQGRNRTTDTVIFSHVLYQLSYLGIASPAEDRGRSAAL